MGEGGLSLLPPKDKKNANMHACVINRHVNRRGTKPEVNLVRWAQTKVCGFSCVPMNYVGVCEKGFPVSDSESLECSLNDPKLIVPFFIRQQLCVTYS